MNAGKLPGSTSATARVGTRQRIRADAPRGFKPDGLARMVHEPPACRFRRCAGLQTGIGRTLSWRVKRSGTTLGSGLAFCSEVFVPMSSGVMHPKRRLGRPGGVMSLGSSGGRLLNIQRTAFTRFHLHVLGAGGGSWADRYQRGPAWGDRTVDARRSAGSTAP